MGLKEKRMKAKKSILDGIISIPKTRWTAKASMRLADAYMELNTRDTDDELTNLDDKLCQPN